MEKEMPTHNSKKQVSSRMSIKVDVRTKNITQRGSQLHT